jgi:transposase-like protein
VLEAASMNAHDCAAYCRRRGIQLAQLKRWRQDCEQAAALGDERRRQESQDTRAERKRVRKLEKELKRKDAALAETAALLALRKKTEAICGDDGDA